MESDEEAYCSNQEALQEKRSELPTKAETVITKLGLR
jgi:hypothetical protein